MDIKDLLKVVVAKGGSDLHLSPGLSAMIRLNGRLEPLDEQLLSEHDISQMLKTLLPAGKDLETTAVHKELDLAVDIKNVARFRVNIYHDRNGRCAAFRFIPNYIRQLTELGLPEIVSRVSEMRRGLVLVTGPSGSGKTTTLAAIIDMINAKRYDHIITIEDPIEFVHNNKRSLVNQREVGLHTDSFHQALRAALREDPDVILVGEMRDLETVSIAMTAAETGHLILGTMHTKGAAQSVDRIIDIFPASQQEQVRVQLADCLEMVISQLLLPSNEWRKRCLAVEVMTATPAIRQLIRAKKTHQLSTEIETGGQWGMQSLSKSLKSLVAAEKITKETALPWLHERKLFEGL